MPIESAYSPVTYTGDNVTATFAIPFPYQFDSDLLLTQTVIATNVATVLVLGSDYTVAPITNSPAGFGSVTLLAGPLSSADTLTLARDVPVTQETTWVPNDPNPSTAIMNAVDKLTMIAQDAAAQPFDLDGTSAEFLRGDNELTNTLIGPMGGFTLPADTGALFIAGQNADASIKVVGGASSQSAFSFGVDGSANPWDARWVYDPALPAIGWQFNGGPILGTFDNAGNLDINGAYTGSADGSLITTGTIAPARLGSGSGFANSFLNGQGVFTIPTGGGGINTTTTASFTIVAATFTQTVSVADVTGIVVGTQLQISDGTHILNGHVTNIASLDLTVKTDSIVLGSAGNTMASGAAVQGSVYPGNNSILIQDAAVSPTAVTGLLFSGSLAGAIAALSPVELCIFSPIVTGTAQIMAYVAPGALDKAAFGATGSVGVLGWPTNDINTPSTNISPSGANQVLKASAGSSAAFGYITAANITAGTLTPTLLNATNAPTDTYVPAYDNATGHFTWVTNTSTPGGGTSATFLRGDATWSNVLGGGTFIVSNDTPPATNSTGTLITAPTGTGQTLGSGSLIPQVFDGVNWNNITTPAWFSIVPPINVGGAGLIDANRQVEAPFNYMVRSTKYFRSTGGYGSKVRLVSNPTGTITVDPALGSYVRFESVSSDFTIALADTNTAPTVAPNAYAVEVYLEFESVTHTITWPGSIVWVDGATAPTQDTTGTTLIKLVRVQDAGDGRGTRWFGYRLFAAPPTGTVTSVGLTAPSIFSVTGSPVTSSGTLALTLATQGANTFFCAPVSSSGTPTFRAISSNDLPTSGVTAGTYTNATINVDSKGRVIAATSGAGGSTTPLYFVAAPSGSATTDTTNLSGALATAAAAGGGIVVLQAGQYQLNATLDIGLHNVSILGAGASQVDSGGGLPSNGTRIVWKGSVGGTMMLASGTEVPEGCTYSGFALFGGTTIANQAAIGIRVGGARACAFRDLAFGNFSGFAIDLLANGDDSLGSYGPNNCTFDNINIDVGTLYWQAYNGTHLLSPCTAVGIRCDSSSGTADAFCNAFSNISIVHNYVGVWLGNSDNNSFTDVHCYGYPNSIGADGALSFTWSGSAWVKVSGNPQRGVYVTTDSRINRFFGLASHLTIATSNGQASVDDFDFIDDTTTIQDVVSVGTGGELRLTNSCSVSGTRVNAGTYYWSPSGTNTTPLSTTYADSDGKIWLTNRAGTITKF